MKIYIFLLVVVLSFLGCEKEMMDYEEMYINYTKMQ